MTVRTALVALAAVVVASAGVAYLAFRQAGDERRSSKLPEEAGQSPVAYAAGTSAANIALDDGDEAVVLRWVARHDGTLSRLHLQAKVATPTCRGRDNNKEGYAGGDTGLWRVTTHPVEASGVPDLTRTLAEDEFQPCSRVSRGAFSVPLNLRVAYDAEYATVIRNVASDPSRDYASVNFLGSSEGVLGANGRNERSPDADDAVYGLDPRELVGWSTDGGKSWQLPGGPYDADGKPAFIPTYVQEYADGTRAGQPYYYGGPASGHVAVRYPDVDRPWTITGLGAQTFDRGAADVVLTVDGTERARVHLDGDGWLHADIDPVDVPEGADVEVSTTAGDGGLAAAVVSSDRAWANLMGLGSGFRWQAVGADAASPTTIYPLPAIDAQPPA